MPKDESSNEFHDLTRDAQNTANDAKDADDAVATPTIALPLGTTPLVGASFGAAGAFSPATAGNAPLAGAALPLIAPLLADEGRADHQTAGDGALAERVEVAFADDGRITHSQTITVTAAGNGVVELGGTAGSEHDRALAETIAARLPGVAAVHNGIRVAAA